MKKIICLLTALALLVTATAVLAQTSEITGEVISQDDGMAIPGVTVSVKAPRWELLPTSTESIPSRFLLTQNTWFSAILA